MDAGVHRPRTPDKSEVSMRFGQAGPPGCSVESRQGRQGGLEKLKYVWRSQPSRFALATLPQRRM